MVLSEINLVFKNLIEIRINELHDQAYRLEMIEVHPRELVLVIFALLQVMRLTENVERAALFLGRFRMDTVLQQIEVGLRILSLR